MANGISIVLTCYNGARWIDKAIESVLAQTRQDFELIIVDDGSKDDSKLKINSYLSDARIRYTYQENSGFSAAINRGLRESRGEFIGFIGQDDMWMPKKLQYQIEYLKNHEHVGVVYSNYISVNSEEQITGVVRAKAPSSSRRETVKSLFLSNFIGFETALARRECFDRVGFFDEHLVGFSDYDFWLRIAGQFDIGLLDKVLVKKRMHKHQLSIASRMSVIQDEFLVARKALGNYPYLGELCARKYGSLFYLLGVTYLQQGNVTLARRCLLKAFRLQPFKLKALLIYLAPNEYNKIVAYYQRFMPSHARLRWLED